MDPEEHRFLLLAYLGLGPNVQRKAVLARGADPPETLQQVEGYVGDAEAFVEIWIDVTVADVCGHARRPLTLSAWGRLAVPLNRVRTKLEPLIAWVSLCKYLTGGWKRRSPRGGWA